MVALAQIVALIPLPAVLVGPDDRIRAANARACDLLGGDIIDRLFSFVWRQPSVLQSIARCLDSGAPQQIRGTRHVGAQTFSYQVHCAALDLDPGRRVVVVSFDDITDQEQMGQMRRDFVANVSHELRTPLTALMGFIETLQGPAQDDAAARLRFLDIMAAEADRMNRLVRDLLSLSQVEAQERQRPQDRVDIIALLAETCRALAPVARAHSVTLAPGLPADALHLPGDADQLRQVFSNLIENALKYSGPGATVSLRIFGPQPAPWVEGEVLEIQVNDTGPGIEPHHLPRLTERFYRVDSHRSRQMGGTGLGLAIVKHIVTRHRGRLSVTSTPGQGSCFSVSLPIR